MFIPLSKESQGFAEFIYNNIQMNFNNREKADYYFQLYLNVAGWYAQSRGANEISIVDLEKAGRFAYDLTSPDYPRPKQD